VEENVNPKNSQKAQIVSVTKVNSFWGSLLEWLLAIPWLIFSFILVNLFLDKFSHSTDEGGG